MGGQASSEWLSATLSGRGHGHAVMGNWVCRQQGEIENERWGGVKLCQTLIRKLGARKKERRELLSKNVSSKI